MVGLGCWQLGADWGEVTDDTAMAILDAAAEAGVTTCYDAPPTCTATGASEQLVGRF
ncbi:MAG: aldo/keto reductase [Nocardioides sp.]